jgi:hypothetical protein
MGNCSNVIHQDEFPEETRISEFERSFRITDTFFNLNSMITSETLLNNDDWIKLEGLLNILTYNIPETEIFETPEPSSEHGMASSQADCSNEEMRKTQASKFRNSILRKTRSVDMTTPKQEKARRQYKNERERIKEHVKDVIKDAEDFFEKCGDKKTHKLNSFKVTLLCFLLCPSSEIYVTSNYKVLDKATYFFQNGKFNEDEVIKRKSHQFETFIEYIVAIACEYLPMAYLLRKTEAVSEEENYLAIISRYSNEISEKITNDMFGEKDTLTQSDITSFFENDETVI